MKRNAADGLLTKPPSVNSLPQVPAKAIIPAAGLGSRLGPITRVLPKEMFPVGDYPAIEWVLAEALASGCRDIAVVISPRKPMIEEYLSTHRPSFPLRCRLSFLVQSEPLGLGHALALAREFGAGQPVAVLLPDEVVAGSRLPLLDMAAAFAARGGAAFALVEESSDHTNWSANWNLQQVDEGVYALQPVTGPRTPDADVSRLVGVGRYLLSPECLEHAETLASQAREGELDDGMIFRFMIAAGRPVHGILVTGRRYDISTTDGYIGALQNLARTNPVREYLAP